MIKVPYNGILLISSDYFDLVKYLYGKFIDKPVCKEKSNG
jgi:phosphosulfolactate synthase (CoM biosynthesis protein A)